MAITGSRQREQPDGNGVETRTRISAYKCNEKLQMQNTSASAAEGYDQGQGRKSESFPKRATVCGKQQSVTLPEERRRFAALLRPLSWLPKKPESQPRTESLQDEKDEHDEKQEQDEFEHGTGDGTGAPGAGS
ncbi:GM24113 [Drosophila sechellia]|uniref:GM24113 n=1 Tax=Drosophila sechellia TaxID=7238 RepID=B4HFR7_DROSE|nr:GM24113 [Drosophila sechellia]